MKRPFKIIIGIFVVVLVAAIGIGVFVFQNMGGAGSGLLEKWIGSQLQAIANGYLNPQLSFSDLDYQAPYTVSLKNLRLVADDPGNPGKTIDIIGCGKATVTLAEIPSTGKPIVIEKIMLDQPLFSAVAVAPKSKEFVGFSHLIRTGPSADSAAPAPSPAPAAPAAAPAPANRPKLSDVFRMRVIELKDGKILYDPRIPGTDAMALDQINTVLNITPTEPGWYKVATAIARKPVFNIDIAGQVNLDTFAARDMAIKTAADLNQDKLDYLPPQIQQLLKQYEVKGALTAQIVASQIQVMDPLKGQLTADLKLSQANVTLTQYRIPIDNLEMSARMEDGKVNLPKLTIAALKGTADITGSATLNDKIDGDLKLKIAGMMLQELLAHQAQGNSAGLAGKLNVDVQAAAPFMIVVAKAMPPSTQPGATPSPLAAMPLPDKWGSATINLTEGKLVALPMISGLTEAISAAFKIVNVGGSSKTSETVAIASDFTRDQVTVNDFNYVGDVVAVRGKGTVGLDRKLDLKINGGPVEKVQAMLGKEVGGMIGAVTDNLVSYRVTGVVGHPQVGVEVGGGSGAAVADTTKKAAEGVGSGVQKVGEGIGKGLDSIFKKDGQK